MENGNEPDASCAETAPLWFETKTDKYVLIIRFLISNPAKETA